MGTTLRSRHLSEPHAGSPAEAVMNELFGTLFLRRNKGPVEVAESLLERVAAKAKMVLHDMACFSSDLRDELVQRFFLRVLEKELIGTFTPQRGNADAYFGAVMRKVALEVLREQQKHRRHVPLDLLDVAGTSHGQAEAERHEMIAVVRSAIDKLTPCMQAVIQDDLEEAKPHGRDARLHYLRRHRAHKRLREMLGASYGCEAGAGSRSCHR